MEKSERALPIPNPDTEPFWKGCAQGRLLLQHCSGCGAYRHPPSPICQVCWSPEHEWRAASGRGKVYSYVVVHEQLRGWVGPVPYVVAIIELQEGPHIVSNVMDVPWERVGVGMEVEVFFERATEEISLPLFRPAGRQ